MKSPQSRGSWMAGFWSVCSQPRTDPEKPSRAVGEPTSNEVTHLVLSPASGQQQSEPTPVKSRAFTGFAHTHFLFGVSKDKASVWCGHGLQSTRLLCPWDFPGKNTGVGCPFLLQGIFPTQGSNQRLLHWQMDSLPLNHQGSS